MNEPFLSILTPAVPSRLSQLQSLMDWLAPQIGSLNIEHLVLLDNKRRTVGEKRDALLRAARGKYVAFVDDDDCVSSDYIRRILEASEGNPDVITFLQRAEVNQVIGIAEFRLGNPNEAFKPEAQGHFKRNAWHVCAWRRTLAILSSFPASNYGEDWIFASKLCALEGLREVHIPEILHFYYHSAASTEAPPP